jgi:ABC-type sugar transport system ATPase subunit
VAGLSSLDTDTGPVAPEGGVHLEIRGVGKSFGGTRALHEVSLEVRTGSVHAFVGENGAGKSTLGKIVAGVLPPDDGQLILKGEPVSFGSPRQALDRGIALVAQEVTLVPQRSVAENVFLGVEPRRFGFVRRRALLDRYERVVAGAGFEVPATATVGALPLAKQQQVEILRALARDAELIVFDEPTAALSAVEIQRFHEIVRSLTANGRTVILVSHFLSEVLELADTVTILRDGKVVRTGPAAGETEDTLVAAMLGRSIGRTYPPKVLPPADAPAALTVKNLTAAGVDGASLDIRAGEIVGLAGLVGAGRSEFARAIYGAVPASAAELSAGSQPLPGKPLGSIRAKVAMIPESRKDDGLMLRRPVRENVSLSSLRDLGRYGFVRRRIESDRARAALTSVAASSTLETVPAALSGGNQQKLMFARALLAEPAVLIADDPTRGVDVGAKRDLYQLIVDLAARGVAILLISNEIEEILGLAHRVVVMRAGRVVAELAGDEMSEEAILASSFGRTMAAAG